MDLDDLLPQVGEFGRYQKLLVWLVCLPACIPCGFCAFNQLFMADVPSHWCYIPELMDVPGIGPQDRRRLSIPTEVSGVNLGELCSLGKKNGCMYVMFEHSSAIPQKPQILSTRGCLVESSFENHGIWCFRCFSRVCNEICKASNPRAAGKKNS
jgi:hypothetical protein